MYEPLKLMCFDSMSLTVCLNITVLSLTSCPFKQQGSGMYYGTVWKNAHIPPCSAGDKNLSGNLHPDYQGRFGSNSWHRCGRRQNITSKANVQELISTNEKRREMNWKGMKSSPNTVLYPYISRQLEVTKPFILQIDRYNTM